MLFSINILALDRLQPFQVHGIDQMVAHKASGNYIVQITWSTDSYDRDENGQKLSFWLQMSKKSRFFAQDVI